MIKMIKKINWLERLGDLTIIVLGILVAFSLHSCWESLTEASREQAYLVRLKADFQENRRRLDETIERERKINAKIKAAVELFKTPPSAENAESMAELMPGMLTFPRLVPVSGTYGALISSGDIKLLENDDLRRHLVSFAGTLEVAREELGRLSDWMYEILSRQVAREFILAELQVTDPSQQQGLIKKYKDQVYFVDLLADKRFSKLVADLWMGSNRRLVTYETLSEEMKKVTAELTLVEEE